MTNDTMITIGLSALAIVFVLYRQLRTRPLAPSYRMPLIMGLIGIGLTVVQLHQGVPVTTVDVITFVLGLVLAVALAWPRARSMKVFRRDGQWLTRGTWLTVVLWLVLIASHLAVVVLLPQLLGQTVHQMSALDQATTLIYLGVSIGLQSCFRARLIPVTTSTASGDLVETLR